MSFEGTHFPLKHCVGVEMGSAPSLISQIYGDMTFGLCKSTIYFLASFLPVR